MKARLVYDLNGNIIELGHGDLLGIDAFIYGGFKTEDRLIKCSAYVDRLANLSKDGKVRILVKGKDMSPKEIECLSYFEDFSPDMTYSFDPLFRDKGVKPTIGGVTGMIACMLSSVPAIKEFHEIFKERFTSQDEFLYQAGIINEDSDMATFGVRRILKESFNGEDSYGVARIFAREIGTLESVNNNDKTGSCREYSKTKISD